VVFAVVVAAASPAEKRRDGIRMKTNWTNVLVGTAVIAAVVYFLYPTAPRYEGFAEQSVGSILGMVFAGIMGVGILLAFFGAMGEVGKTE
jgi:protein-S-isoprenylcysteine O-methyltransferase Ste14